MSLIRLTRKYKWLTQGLLDVFYFFLFLYILNIYLFLIFMVVMLSGAAGIQNKKKTDLVRQLSECHNRVSTFISCKLVSYIHFM